MDAKTAYCYLNCTASANCCGICGECPACCKDCPTDYSTFSNTAYYKDGSFYKNFTSTHSYSINADYSDVNSVAINSISYTSTYKSKNSQCSVIGSSQTSSCGDDGDVTVGKWSCSGSTCYGLVCDNNEDCWIGGGGCNGSCRSDCGGTYTPSCGSCTDDTCGTFNHGCSGLECVCDPGECEGSYVSVYTAKISFEDTVQLYNSQGEVVDPSFIGASYDPCNPCATWSAACHFFAP